MTTRAPFNMQRLTPVQMALALTTALILLAVVALIVAGFHSTTVANDALSSGHVLTDLSRIERQLHRLHVATQQALARPLPDTQGLELEMALLSNQVRVAATEVAPTADMARGFDTLRGLLVEYYIALYDLRGAADEAESLRVQARLYDILARLEMAVRAIYDQQEAHFYGRLARGLNNQRTAQAMLLVTAVTLVLLGGSLLLSLRRSVGYEFERAYAMLEALYRADEELHRNVQVAQVLRALVEIATDILGASHSVMLVWEPADPLHPRLAEASGFTPKQLEELRAGLVETPLPADQVGTEPIIVGDTAKDERRPLHIGRREGVRAYIVIPILLDSAVYGALAACYDAPRTFDADDVRLVRALARRASSAVENARLYARAEATATLEERQRLARELHDAVTQTLFAASLIAEVLPRLWERDPERARERLEELRELTRGALAEMRTLLLELRPAALEEARLGDLLRQLAEATTGRSRVPVVVQLDGEAELPSEVKVAFYRVAQEALNNIAKHAQASQAWVQLRAHDGRTSLSIGDDGRGFDPAAVPPNHLGLGIMRERAARIGAAVTIESAPGHGTLIRIAWPEQAGGEA